MLTDRPANCVHILPFWDNSLSSTTSTASLSDGASSPSSSCLFSASDRSAGSALRATPPSRSSEISIPAACAANAASSLSSSHPCRTSGGSDPGLPAGFQDHSSSPHQWNVETAWPFMPCTLPKELTSISHVPTAMGTDGASKDAIATTAPRAKSASSRSSDVFYVNTTHDRSRIFDGHTLGRHLREWRASL